MKETKKLENKLVKVLRKSSIIKSVYIGAYGKNEINIILATSIPIKINSTYII